MALIYVHINVNISRNVSQACGECFMNDSLVLLDAVIYSKNLKAGRISKLQFHHHAALKLEISVNILQNPFTSYSLHPEMYKNVLHTMNNSFVELKLL